MSPTSEPPCAPAPVLVRDLDELRALTHAGWRLTPAHRLVRLELPGLHEHEAARLERTLARHIAPCGCDAAALTLVLTILVGGVWLVGRALGPGSVTVASVLGLLGASVAAVMAGKVLGIAVSLLLLRMAYARAQRAVNGSG